MQLIWFRESRLFKEAFFQWLIYLLAGLLALWLPAVLWLQTSRYGWKPAAADRKLISQLSALARQPGIPHLNTTNKIQARLVEVVPLRLELSAVTGWSLTYGLCDRHHFCQMRDLSVAVSPTVWETAFGNQEAGKLNWWHTVHRRLTLTL